MKQADVDDGRTPGLTSDERAELVALRRKNRVLELEVEILKRASAYFALRVSTRSTDDEWAVHRQSPPFRLAPPEQHTKRT
jgi:transposase-like protein